MPKSRQMAFAWPICKYPLGSGGKRVTTRPPFLPSATSAATMSRIKSCGADAGAATFSSCMCRLHRLTYGPQRLGDSETYWNASKSKHEDAKETKNCCLYLS